MEENKTTVTLSASGFTQPYFKQFELVKFQQPNKWAIIINVPKEKQPFIDAEMGYATQVTLTMKVVSRFKIIRFFQVLYYKWKHKNRI